MFPELQKYAQLILVILQVYIFNSSSRIFSFVLQEQYLHIQKLLITDSPFKSFV